MNAAKVLAHVLGTKGMYINSFYTAIDKDNSIRYQKIENFKAARKSVIRYYSENIKSSISSLQNKSSTVIDSTIHLSYKCITSSNDTQKYHH